MKIRLDELLVRKNITTTRSQAKQLILQGKIKLYDKVVLKPSLLLNPNDRQEISLADENLYVSRGAYKLIHAIECFNIEVTGKIAADIGASTGGFTEVLLENGISRVYAIDVGQDQLAQKLRHHPKVINIEKTNIKNLKKLDEKCDLAVVDLSFISLTKVLDNIRNLLKPDGQIIALIKPQFETDSTKLNKSGVVKPQYLGSILDEFNDWIEKNGFLLNKKILSPVKGKAGNTEYLGLITF